MEPGERVAAAAADGAVDRCDGRVGEELAEEVGAEGAGCAGEELRGASG